jgi:hypothetical protein
LIAVPQEQQPEVPYYRHQQVFSLEKLERWGNWCVNQLHSKGQYWCEEVMGEMLIIERAPEEK